MVYFTEQHSRLLIGNSQSSYARHDTEAINPRFSCSLQGPLRLARRSLISFCLPAQRSHGICDLKILQQFCDLLDGVSFKGNHVDRIKQREVLHSAAGDQELSELFGSLYPCARQHHLHTAAGPAMLTSVPCNFWPLSISSSSVLKV